MSSLPAVASGLDYSPDNYIISKSEAAIQP